MSTSKTQINKYITELKKYNETTNIYSKKAYDKLDFHIGDGVRLAEIIGDEKRTVLDIGSGSGLPSIIIAIHNPNNKVIAVESKSRKTNFLSHIKEMLKLENLTVITQDINQYIQERQPKVDIVTAKAYGSLEKLLRVCDRITRKPTYLYIPISNNQKEELESRNTPRLDLIQYPKENLFYAKYSF